MSTWQMATPLWFIPEGYAVDLDEGPLVAPDIDLLEAKAMTSCPAYRDGGRCQSGCWVEPVCQTDEPMEGWPNTEGLVVVVPELSTFLSDPPEKMRP